MLLYDTNNILYLICLSAVFKVGWPSVSELFEKKQHNMSKQDSIFLLLCICTWT